jgi:proline iminopeptidase
MFASQRKGSYLHSCGRHGSAILIGLCLSVFGGMAGKQSHEDSGSFIDIKGQRIWCQIQGEGEPVVLIPGGPGSSHLYFTPWFDKLSKDFKVVYYDAFGRGKSSRAMRKDEYSFERDVQDLEGLRLALGFNKWSVLGHSYGGMVAQAYALRYPDSVTKLILSNTLYDSEMWQKNDDSCNYELENQYPERWEKLMILRRQGHVSSSPEHIKAYDLPPGLLFFYDASNVSKLNPGTDRPDFNWDVYYRIVGEDADFIVGGDIAGLDFKQELKDLKMPALIVAGRYDRVCVPSFSVCYKEYAPQAEFVMFEKSGHYPFIEEQELYMNVVARFLGGPK